MPGTGIPGINFASLASSGRYVLFSTDRKGLAPDDQDDRWDLFVRDLMARTTTRLRVASGGAVAAHNAYDLGISADGRYVLFLSFATNLLPGGSSGQHVYRHDRQTVQVDVGHAGADADGLSFAGSLSSDGRRAAFQSDSTNLVAVDTNSKLNIFVRDIVAGTTAIVSTGFRTGEQS